MRISPVFKVLDLLAAACALPALCAWIVLRSLLAPRRLPGGRRRTLLVLDMSYTLEAVKARQLDEPITARDLGGFFSHVWSVHPCATVVAPEGAAEQFGPIVVTPFAERHTIIEAKIGRFRGLQRLPTLNFLAAQFELLRYLRRLVVRERITAIRAGDPYYLGIFGLAVARMTGVPTVFRIPLNYDTFYARMGHLAYPRLFRFRRVEQFVSRYALKRADLVAGSNKDSLDFALDNGAAAERATIFRVGNLIHKAHFQPPDERPDASSILASLGLSGRRFSITMCRLEQLKHIDDVLHALQEVRARGVDLTALLVGDGRLRGELEALAVTLGVSQHVVFAGNRSQEWIAAVLPHAAVVLSPHMGRGLTEALLSGVPAVAYDVEWQSEIVITGRTGELVPYRDWRAMAAAIQRICGDQEYARRLGTAARAFTLEMMDPARLSAHERSEWLKLLARVGSGAAGRASQPREA